MLSKFMAFILFAFIAFGSITSSEASMRDDYENDANYEEVTTGSGIWEYISVNDPDYKARPASIALAMFRHAYSMNFSH